MTATFDQENNLLIPIIFEHAMKYRVFDAGSSIRVESYPELRIFRTKDFGFMLQNPHAEFYST